MNENGRLYSFLVTLTVFYVRSVDIGCFKWDFYCPILGHCLTVKKNYLEGPETGERKRETKEGVYYLQLRFRSLSQLLVLVKYCSATY